MSLIPVDLNNITSHRTCFYTPKGWGVCACRPPGRRCSRIVACHGHISRAHQGHYAPRMYLRVWLNKKNVCVLGGGREERTVLKKASCHQVLIMADLSDMASVWFTHSQIIKIGRGPSDCVMKYRKYFKSQNSVHFFFPSKMCSFFKEQITELLN